MFAGQQSQRSRYSYILRAIGQSLEEKRIVEFDLVVVERNYLVYSRRKLPRSSLHDWWDGFWTREAEGECIEYSAVDIEWLNYRGESRRRATDREPSFRVLSQRLRTIGAYIDLRRMRLLKLSVRGRQWRIHLQDQAGGERFECHWVESFQDYFRFLSRQCRFKQPAIEVEFEPSR